MSFLASFANIWRDSTALCALVPFDRVFTGRVPGTEYYKFPYINIQEAGPTRRYRSDKSQGYYISMSFHIWVDDSRLSTGEQIECAIAKAYAENAWTIDGDYKVIDVLDEGPAQKHQINESSYKAWEIIKLLTVCLERARSGQ